MDDFREEIGQAAWIRVLRDLRRLSEEGNKLRFPHTDSLGDGLFELRTKYNGSIYRMIFIYFQNDIAFVEAFVKKTPKTPKYKVAIAKSRRNDLLIDGVKVGIFKYH